MGNKNSTISNSKTQASNINQMPPIQEEIRQSSSIQKEKRMNASNSIRSLEGGSMNQFSYNDDDPLDDQQSIKANITSEKTEEINLENVVKLTLKLKKKIIQSSSFNAQTFPMLASLAVENLKSSKKAPLDLVCVIDHSGSMSGEKMELVKDSFDYLLKYLGDSDRLSIVIFDSSASRLVPLLRTTESNKGIILTALQDVHGAGGTNINLGMVHAFEILKQRRYCNPVTSIFLLSDGLNGRAQDKVRASLAQYNIPEEVTINTFGFGKDHDPQLMSDIADLRNGNFYFIEKLDTVDEAFIDCLGGLLSVAAQSAIIKIQPEQSEVLKGVEIVKAYGEESMWNRDQQTYITKLTSLISGRQKDFVLELMIPVNKNELQDHQKNIKVASAIAEITGLNNQKITKKTDLHITLLNEIEEFKEEEEDDRDVMKNFYRVKGASLMSEANKLAGERKNEDAKKMLKAFKEELENSFLKNEDFVKNLIKDIEQAVQDVDPVVYKEVGRHNMILNSRTQMQQRSNFKSDNNYQNDMQMEMLKEVRFMKSKK